MKIKAVFQKKVVPLQEFWNYWEIGNDERLQFYITRALRTQTYSFFAFSIGLNRGFCCWLDSDRWWFGSGLANR